MKTHKIFLVVGSFGVGKTTVCSAYPDFQLEGFRMRFQAFRNLYSYGYHIRGLDSLNDAKRPVSKAQLVEKLKVDSGKNFLLHGTFYQYRTDIVNFYTTHELHIIHLDVTYETNIERLRGRNPNFNAEKTEIRIKAKHREVASFLRSCRETPGVVIHTVNANQDAPTVKREAWKIIFRHLTR